MALAMMAQTICGVLIGAIVAVFLRIGAEHTPTFWSFIVGFVAGLTIVLLMLAPLMGHD